MFKLQNTCRGILDSTLWDFLLSDELLIYLFLKGLVCEAGWHPVFIILEELIQFY